LVENFSKKANGDNIKNEAAKCGQSYKPFLLRNFVIS
jgi:hypothetical protein